MTSLLLGGRIGRENWERRRENRERRVGSQCAKVRMRAVFTDLRFQPKMRFLADEG